MSFILCACECLTKYQLPQYRCCRNRYGWEFFCSSHDHPSVNIFLHFLLRIWMFKNLFSPDGCETGCACAAKTTWPTALLVRNQIFGNEDTTVCKSWFRCDVVMIYCCQSTWLLWNLDCPKKKVQEELKNWGLQRRYSLSTGNYLPKTFRTIAVSSPSGWGRTILLELRDVGG